MVTKIFHLFIHLFVFSLVFDVPITTNRWGEIQTPGEINPNQEYKTHLIDIIDLQFVQLLKAGWARICSDLVVIALVSRDQLLPSLYLGGHLGPACQHLLI